MKYYGVRTIIYASSSKILQIGSTQIQAETWYKIVKILCMIKLYYKKL